MTSIGTAIRRPDARSKAEGRALYTGDIAPHGLLHGVVVRSPHAAARITGVERTEALAISGVVAVLDGSDVPAVAYGLIYQDETLLAHDVVRYVGEPVALVAAESREAAIAAAKRLEVRYEPIGSAVDLESAIRDDAPPVHADRPNVMEPSLVTRGDVDEAFGRADKVVRSSFQSQRVHQAYLEPRVALAEVTVDGLVITTSTQAPFSIRASTAALLDVPLADITVRVPMVGGGFGGKLQPGVAPLAAALALATNRPVRVVCSREEELQASNPRENSIIELESAVTSDGVILGRRAVVYVDAGAYAAETPAVASVTALQSTGPYDIDSVHARAHAVYTNTASTGAMRGPGAPQMMYATEAHMNDIAEELRMSPIDLRRKNAFRDGSLGPTGQLISDPALTTCMDLVANRLAEWKADASGEDHGDVRRGYGLALGWWSTGIAAGSAATVTLDEQGIATVHTGATEIGTGAVVSGVALLVAERLGLEFDKVRVVSGNTNEPYDVGSEGSRTMYGAGAAAQRAAGEIATIIADAASEALEASPSDIVLEDGRVVVAGSPDRGLDLAEAVRLASGSGPVIGTGRFMAPTAEFDGSCVAGMFLSSNNEPTFHCHGAEVHVDRATGEVRIARYIAAHDIGRAVNPVGVHGQIEGGVVQGIGYALYEEVQTASDGRTVNDNFTDYRIPTAADIPELLEVELVEGHLGEAGPHGVKGIGEAPALLPAAALGSAIRDAVGAQPAALPMTPVRVVECLNARGSQPPSP